MGRWFEPSRRSHIKLEYQRVAAMQPFFMPIRKTMYNDKYNNSSPNLVDRIFGGKLAQKFTED
jgi:hypothetical protein